MAFHVVREKCGVAAARAQVLRILRIEFEAFRVIGESAASVINPPTASTKPRRRMLRVCDLFSIAFEKSCRARRGVVVFPQNQQNRAGDTSGLLRR